MQAAQAAAAAESVETDALAGRSLPESDEAREAPMKDATNAQGGDGELPEEVDDEEREYAQFLAQEQEHFKAAAAAKARREEQAAKREDDRAISTRRRVRELDEAPTSSLNALDYD